MFPHSSEKGESMATTCRTHKFTVSGGTSNYELQVEPIGVRKCKLVDWFFPYLYGSEVQFRLKINPTPQHNISFKWFLKRWNGEQVIPVNDSGEKAGEIQKGNRTLTLDVGYLSITGHHMLSVKLGDELPDKEPTLVANFTIVDRTIYYLNWLQILGTGLIGGIIGALATLAIKGN